MYFLWFDLDNTLINDISNLLELDRKMSLEERYQACITDDPVLSSLLDDLPYHKGIINNSNRQHIDLVLRLLKINSKFEHIISKEDIIFPQPLDDAYQNAQQYIDKKCPFMKIVIFDDIAENLVVPHQMGWCTVLIGDTNAYKHVDFCFSNIYDALEGITPLLSSNFINKNYKVTF